MTFETQHVGSSEGKIIKRAFEHDPKYTLDNLSPDASIFDSETVTNFPLDPSFLDHKDFQKYESYVHVDLRLLDEIEQTHVGELEGEELQAFYRRVIRKTYPLYVKLVPGVLYDAKKRIIYQSFGKIDFIYQQEINLDLVFKDFPSGQTRSQKKSLIDVEKRMREMEINENSQDLSQLVESQNTPLTRVSSLIHADKRTYADVVKGVVASNEEEYPHLERPQTPLPFSDLTNAPKKRKFVQTDNFDDRRKRFASCSRVLFPREIDPQPSTSQTGYNYRMSEESKENYTLRRPDKLKMPQILKYEFFNLNRFDIRYDKKQNFSVDSVVGDPDFKSLQLAAKKFRSEKDLDILDTVAVGSSLYGEGFLYINLLKFANSYSAHCVNFSVREAPKVIVSILRATCKVLSMHSEAKLESARQEARALRLQGKRQEGDDLENDATDIFRSRMLDIQNRLDSLTNFD